MAVDSTIGARTYFSVLETLRNELLRQDKVRTVPTALGFSFYHSVPNLLGNGLSVLVRVSSHLIVSSYYIAYVC